MVELTIKVTRQNIRDGEVGSPSQCPIAQALSRVAGASDIAVDDETIEINGLTFVTPSKAARFIARFDDEKKVEPFIFKLRA